MYFAAETTRTFTHGGHHQLIFAAHALSRDRAECAQPSSARVSETARAVVRVRDASGRERRSHSAHVATFYGSLVEAGWARQQSCTCPSVGCTRPRVGGVATTGNSRLPVVLPVVLPVIPALVGHSQVKAGS